MADRGLADQISEWRERGGEGRIGAEFTYKVADLIHYWNAHEGDFEAAEFVIIRLVTIVEVFVRVTIASLIDSDPAYVERAEPLLLRNKLDYGVAKSLFGRKVTLGEIIAHSISLNDVAQIIAAYGHLIPDFRKKLGTITERWIEEKGADLAPIMKDSGKTIGAVGRVFQMRHILVHELPAVSPYHTEEIGELLAEGACFLDAIDWQLTAETKGYVPRTQANMTGQAGDDAEREAIILRDALGELEGRGDMNAERLQLSQAAWEAFLDADSSLYASLAEGGSMESMLYHMHRAELTRARSATIKAWLAREEGEF